MIKTVISVSDVAVSSTEEVRTSGKNAVVVMVEAANWNASEVKIFIRSENGVAKILSVNGTITAADAAISLGILPEGLYVSATLTGPTTGDEVTVNIHA